MSTLDLSSLHDAIRRRFAPPEHVLLWEVRNGTGYTKRERYADAVAMNVWPSRGLEIHGIECKVSRSDTARELKDPEKSASVQSYCDRWWLAVGDERFVAPGELPPTWGLLVPKGKGLVAKVEAPKLEAKALDRTFVASLLRSATEQSKPKEQIEAQARALLEQWQKQEEATNRRALTSVERNLADLRRAVDDFERASGVRIDRWHGGNVGEAVRIVEALGGIGRALLRKQLTNTRDTYSNLAGQIDRLLEATAAQEPATEEEGSAA